MADISITDQTQITANLAINDGSPFAIAQLAHLDFSNVPIIGDFAKPVDQCSFRQLDLGALLNSPALLLPGQTGFTIKGGANARLSICPEKNKFLFAHDATNTGLFNDAPYSPDIAISPGQCWIGLELDAIFGQAVGAAFGSFGIAVNHSNQIGFGTYLLFDGAVSPLPSLKDALKAILENFSIGANSEAFTNLPIGTVHTVRTAGEVSVCASYMLPVSVNPLASAQLPFQFKLSLQPVAAIQLNGSIKLSGEFIIRAHRRDKSTLILGLFKKQGATLTASFTAKAGVAAEIGTTDILSPILGAVLGSADLKPLKLDPQQAQELNLALRSCVDQSFSAALNATCSAALADEAAIVYSIDLTQATAQTSIALAAALKGDWSALDSLPNATPIRNIVTETHDRKHRVNVNLLGLFNATSIHDYLQSSKVLHDGAGQIVLIDSEGAKSLAATDTPYAAKPDKLRAALAQAFLSTISYGAASSLDRKLAIQSFTIRQSYLEYNAKASPQNLHKYILLARSLGIPVSARWDELLQSAAASDTGFHRAKCYLDAQYSLNHVLRIFYADPEKRAARTQQELDAIGRNTKLSLLDPSMPNALPRRMALSSDAIWQSMRDDGNVRDFRLIAALSKLPDPALAAVSADYVDIAWWSNAMQQIPAKLTAVLQSLDASTTSNPLEDPAFLSRQKALQTVLANVTANTQSAFGDGWGMAVIHLCASRAGSSDSPFVQMDIGWNNQFEHYEAGAPVAIGARSA